MTPSTPANLAADVESRAAGDPDAPALLTIDGECWSWAGLDAEASRTAAALRGLGVERGHRVGLFLPNGPALVFCLLGAWKIGAVPVPYSFLYNEAELASSAAKTEPVLVVVEGERGAVAASVLCCPTTDWDGDFAESRRAAPTAVPCVTMRRDEEGVVLFTGGTTGEPKAVAGTQIGVLEAAMKLAAASKGGRPGPYRTVSAETAPNLGLLPLFHSGGQQALVFAFHVGRAVLVADRFRVSTVFRAVREFGVDNLFLMPTMVYDLAYTSEEGRLEGVRGVLVAGQALSPTVRRDFEERYGVPILSNYGSTEMGHVAGWTGRDVAAGLWRPGSVGRVYPGVQVEIRSSEGRALPAGEAGEICVRTDLTRGYVGGEGSEELIRDGWVHSGDVGYLDPDGVLYVVGRTREMIKCGGFQIWPVELEEALRAHPAVADAAVLGVPDPRLGEIPVAVVVPGGPSVASGALADELIAFVRERLAHFKAVRRIEFASALPRSEAGKIRKAELTDLFTARHGAVAATEGNQL